MCECLSVWKVKEEMYKALVFEMLNQTNGGDVLIRAHQFISQEERSCRHKLLLNQFRRPLHDVLQQKQCFGNLVLNVAYHIKNIFPT